MNFFKAFRSCWGLHSVFRKDAPQLQESNRRGITSVIGLPEQALLLGATVSIQNPGLSVGGG